MVTVTLPPGVPLPMVDRDIHRDALPDDEGSGVWLVMGGSPCC